jgi:hypothetical protein
LAADLLRHALDEVDWVELLRVGWLCPKLRVSLASPDAKSGE